MAQPGRPGIFIQEQNQGPRPITGVGTAVPVFIGPTERGVIDKPFLATSLSAAVTEFGDRFSSAGIFYFTMFSIFDFFNNGGTRCYIVRVDAAAAAAVVGTVDVSDGSVDTLKVLAKSPGAWGNRIQATFADKVRASTTTNGVISIGATSVVLDSIDGIEKGSIITFDLATDETKEVTAVNAGTKAVSFTPAMVASAPDATPVASAEVDLTVLFDGVIVETFTNLTIGGSGVAGTEISRRYIETIVNDDANGSKFIRITDLDSVTAIPDNRPAPGTVTVGTTVSGSDGTLTSIAATDFTGALTLTDTIDEITLLLAPDMHQLTSDANIKAVIDAFTANAEKLQDRFAIVSVPAGKDVAGAATFAGTLNGSAYGALYYPQVEVLNPATGGFIQVPVDGMHAGIYARTDANRGVFKAPGGTEANLFGAVKLEVLISDSDNEVLLPAKVNPIRSFVGTGIITYGVRTLSSDANFNQVPLRRTLNFIEESLSEGLQFATFEPNVPRLWDTLRLSSAAFLTNFWRAGGLAGDKPADAFFVVSNKDTNPQSEIDAGNTNVEIGVALVRANEFTIIKIGLFDGGRLLQELA